MSKIIDAIIGEFIIKEIHSKSILGLMIIYAIKNYIYFYNIIRGINLDNMHILFKTLPNHFVCTNDFQKHISKIILSGQCFFSLLYFCMLIASPYKILFQLTFYEYYCIFAFSFLMAFLTIILLIPIVNRTKKSFNNQSTL